MRVWVEVDDATGAAWQALADAQGVEVAEVIAAALAGRTVGQADTLRSRIGMLVSLGLTDADIGKMTGQPNATIASNRRALGLAANHRHGARRAAANPD